jgi:hypothetical protein
MRRHVEAHRPDHIRRQLSKWRIDRNDVLRIGTFLPRIARISRMKKKFWSWQQGMVG